MSLPPRPANFVGRDDELIKISNQLDKTGNAIILNGIGGMGKSELLNHWVHKNKSNYENILFLECGDGLISALSKQTTILKSNFGITPEQLTDNHPYLDTLCHQLNQYDKLLLILDDMPWQDGVYDHNIDVFDDLCNINADIIASSRRKYNFFETAIDIEHLDEDNAITLFNKHYPSVSNNTDSILTIIKRAGSHTLLIELLAKQAKAQLLSASELLKKLTDNDFDYSCLTTDVSYRKSKERANEKIHQALTKLFDLSDLDDTQRQLLLHLGAIGSQSFTLQKIKKWLQLEEKQEALAKLTKLSDLGWVQYQPSETVDLFRLHESITYAINAWFDEYYQTNSQANNQATNQQDNKLTQMLIVSQCMEEDYLAQDHLTFDTACLPAIASYLNWQITSCINSDNKDNKITAVKLLNTFADFCEKKGLYNLALTPLENQIDSIAKILGDNHLEYAHSLNNLAELHRAMGNYDKALSLCQQALNIRKEQLDENHPDYATSLNDLARLHNTMENYEKALPLCNQALKIRQQILGENHSDYATSLNNLALLHNEMGKYKKALPLYYQALDIRKEQLGENHPDYASSLNNLAGLHDSVGNTKEALPLSEQAIAIVEKALGNEHPDTQLYKNNYQLVKKKAYSKGMGNNTSIGFSIFGKNKK